MTLSTAIIWLTIAIMLFLVVLLRHKASKISLPNLVTTIGILGTFIGIVWGLFNFDVNHIEQSIPILLHGLKFAFITSIVGMFLAIALRVWPKVFGIKQTFQEDPMHDYLNSIDDSLKKMIEGQEEEKTVLVDIGRAMIGNTDRSILSQLKKGQGETKNQISLLIKVFEQFSEQMAQYNTDALIEALTRVMRDFNTKINEQFGENFKELNLAMGKILAWQKEYGEQVKQMNQQFKNATIAIEHSRQTLNSISENAKEFQNTALSLKSLLVALEEEKNRISQGMDSFAQISEKARSAFPIIQQGIQQMTDQLFSLMKNSFDQHNDLIKNYQDRFKFIMEQNEAYTQNQLKRMQEMQTRLDTDIRNSIEKIQNGLNSSINLTSERMAEQIENLDKQLGEELKRTLSALGSHVLSINRKFIEDYENFMRTIRSYMVLNGN